MEVRDEHRKTTGYSLICYVVRMGRGLGTNTERLQAIVWYVTWLELEGG